MFCGGFCSRYKSRYDRGVRLGMIALAPQLTGESVPVAKQKGDTVFASTINGEGVLHIEVTHLAEDNTISRIIEMVQEAQAQKAPAQRLIDRRLEPGVQ